jgi:hypothetical protein
MHAVQTPRASRERVAITLAAVAVGLAVAFAPTLYVPCDFIAFWSSATLFAGGRNPYDPAPLLPLQYDAGFQLGYAITMFNPPWVLPLLAPLAALPVRLAFAVCLAVQLALVLVAAGWLWRAFGGDPERKWTAAALAAGFTPTFLLLTGGQLTGLALFGLAGFLRFRPARPALAGCLGALTAVKPHLFGLFVVALVIDAVRCRDGRRVVVAGALTLAGLSALALAVTPDIFADYAAALASPSGVGKGIADYPAAVAFLVAGSLIVAPYGGWWYDMVLLLPLVLVAAVRLTEAGSPSLARIGVAAFVALDVAVLVLYTGRDRLTPLFALVAPAVAVGCFRLLRGRQLAPQPQPAS